MENNEKVSKPEAERFSECATETHYSIKRHIADLKMGLSSVNGQIRDTELGDILDSGTYLPDKVNTVALRRLEERKTMYEEKIKELELELVLPKHGDD